MRKGDRGVLEDERLELIRFAEGAKIRLDWHEPDGQEIEAEICGDHLDNAFGSAIDCSEFVVRLYDVDGDGVNINLATLLALATYREREAIQACR